MTRLCQRLNKVNRLSNTFKNPMADTLIRGGGGGRMLALGID